MSIQNIIQESLNKNPIALKEALSEELRSRVAAVLESMISEKKKDEDDEEADKDDGKPYDDDSKGEFDDDKDDKKTKNEEVEQIDEISTPKLAQYMKKASSDLADKASTREFMKSNLPDLTDKDEKRKEKVDNSFKKEINKRKTGIATAASKISRRHYND